mmetsp:Transcript_6629/g.19995  ORF Transcript_6629/g.19995 Transcript_6629/m.19995 type:complete len:385 (+) Transcript_6629:1166-2320(+)
MNWPEEPWNSRPEGCAPSSLLPSLFWELLSVSDSKSSALASSHWHANSMLLLKVCRAYLERFSLNPISLSCVTKLGSGSTPPATCLGQLLRNLLRFRRCLRLEIAILRSWASVSGTSASGSSWCSRIQSIAASRLLCLMIRAFLARVSLKPISTSWFSLAGFASGTCSSPAASLSSSRSASTSSSSSPASPSLSALSPTRFPRRGSSQRGSSPRPPSSVVIAFKSCWMSLMEVRALLSKPPPPLPELRVTLPFSSASLVVFSSIVSLLGPPSRSGRDVLTRSRLSTTTKELPSDTPASSSVQLFISRPLYTTRCLSGEGQPRLKTSLTLCTMDRRLSTLASRGTGSSLWSPFRVTRVSERGESARSGAGPELAAVVPPSSAMGI